MADRFFPNEMPDFVPETPAEEQSAFERSGDYSLTKLLSLPFNTVADTLKRAALDAKETVVKETWGQSGRRILDYTVYTGALGSAYLLFKAYQITNNKDDLYLCSEIIKACDTVSRDSRQVTFICGRGGVYALGAVVAKHSGDVGLCDQYLTKFKEINLPKDLPNELLYGRAGFLLACSFLNKNIGRDAISSNRTVRPCETLTSI